MKHTTISSDVFAMCAVALFTTLSLVSCTPSTHHAETLPTAPPQTVTTTPSSPALSTDTDAPQNEPAAQAETSPSLLESWYERYRKPPYPLDGESREAIRDKKGRLECPDLEFETYRGTTLKYTKAIKVNAHFKPQLERFEEIVAEVATEVYGRPPSKIWHYGTYNCRTIRKRKHRLSEHAFGNAIDIAGFRFDTLPKSKREGLTHKRAGRSFKVSVLDHWDAEDGFERLHALFLKGLVMRLMHDDVFRGMIVPPAPGHHNHLHLDMGRWSYLRGDITPPPAVDNENQS